MKWRERKRKQEGHSLTQKIDGYFNIKEMLTFLTSNKTLQNYSNFIFQ